MSTNARLAAAEKTVFPQKGKLMRDITIKIRTVETVIDSDGGRREVEIPDQYDAPAPWPPPARGDRDRDRVRVLWPRQKPKTDT